MPQVIINGEAYDKVIVVNSSGNDIAGGGGGGTDISKAEDSAHVSGDFGYQMLTVRQDGDGALTSADGDYAPLVTNSSNRLKVSALPADTAATTGTITANAQTVAIDVRRQGSASLVISGTYTGVNLTFEASDDSTNGTDGTWVSILGARSNANTIENTTGVIATGLTYGYTFGVASWAWIRVRATAFTSGSASITWKPGALATEPAQASQPLPTGANTIGNINTLATITNNVNTVSKPLTTGGTLMSRILSAASTNAAVVKASAGMVYGMQFNNSGATIAFVKLYNKATAPTVGTDVTVDILAIPAGGSREVSRPLGMVYSAGISYAITGGFADADTAAVAAGQVVGSIQYF